jgi:uncharacterized protein (DUF362 family)
MTEISRRNFLRFLAASLGSLGSLYLAGCLDQDKLLSKSIAANKISPTGLIPDLGTLEASPSANTEEVALDQPTSTASPTFSSPDLVVARSGEPEEMVRAAVAALGGMERFVKPGDVVVVKPNICVAYHTFEYAATTNPWVVGAVVKMALEAGAKKVKVMDYPFGGTAEQAYRISGIQDAVQQAGGKMVVMSNIKFVEADIPAGKDLKSVRIFDDVLGADVLINVPIAKNHELARLTLSMKNLMGVIYNRPAMHANLGQRLADLSTRVHSHLMVVDAVRMLMAHGPTGGNLADVKKADTIIASPNIISADSYAATLFGIAPDKLTYIKKGVEMGLGSGNLNEIKIEEINFG